MAKGLQITPTTTTATTSRQGKKKKTSAKNRLGEKKVRFTIDRNNNKTRITRVTKLFSTMLVENQLWWKYCKAKVSLMLKYREKISWICLKRHLHSKLLDGKYTYKKRNSRARITHIDRAHRRKGDGGKKQLLLEEITNLRASCEAFPKQTMRISLA